MPIQDLLELVVTLRKRIDEHGAALRTSEALTRYSLIDPLLRELGWNTEDPAHVIPEYRAPNNQIADYVLLDDGSPFIVVEAKKLGEDLRGGKALDQGILNCVRTGSKFFLLTDGRRWEIFESGSDTPKITFDLHAVSTAEVCLQAMALWRPSITLGNAVVAQTPIIGLPSYQSEATQPSQPPSSKSISTLPFGSTDDALLPLSKVETKQRQKVFELQMPDGGLVKLKRKTWVSAVRAVVKWLIDNEMLQASHCPIKSDKKKSKHYLVNTEPFHQDDKPFGWSTGINGLHVKHYGYLHDNKRAAITVIRHVGQDPSQFRVRVS